ncbi:MAG: PaaI family thioesterase [Acidobacteria bacterium]|nr:PaaI family thioesterase [Acidobacteriota bacterium]
MSDPTRTRTVSWADPAEHAWRASSGPGLEILRKVIAGALPPAPMATLLGYELLEVAEGLAIFGVTPAEYHYNPAGQVHGGFAATLLDSAMGCAVYTTVDTGSTYTTVEIKVNYLKPITVATGPVRAIGRLLHRGRRTAMAEGRLEDAGGRLLAHATTTCLIWQP